MKTTISRRDFFHDIVQTSVTVIGMGAVLTACKGDDAAPAAKKVAPASPQKPSAPVPNGKPSSGILSCTDVADLNDGDKAMRKALAYVDTSSMTAKNCANCTLYAAAPKPGVCGSCTIVKGPINPKGYCNSWVAKAG